MPNTNQYNAGNFTTPTLNQINTAYKQLTHKTHPNNNLNVVILDGDIGHHITLPINNNSTIHVSTHATCLLTATRPEPLTPDDGITAYADNLHTQGHTWAIATGASTIYINYFVKLKKNDDTLDSLMGKSTRTIGHSTTKLTRHDTR